MASSSPATTKAASQAPTQGSGGIMGGSQWQQWFTPPVVVAGTFGTLSLQTAILWGLVGKIDQVSSRIDQVRTDLSAEIRGLGGRIDQLRLD